MSQMTFSDFEYSNRKKKTKKEAFLDVMEEIIPWDEWVAIIKPYYPSGKRGRPTKGIEKMLRMYLLQSWFNLSDEGIEDAIYDSYDFRKFMGIDFNNEQVPDATTLLKFRHFSSGNEISFEVDTWFSEMITVQRGYNLIDKFTSVDDFLEEWEDCRGYTPTVERMIVPLK